MSALERMGRTLAVASALGATPLVGQGPPDGWTVQADGQQQLVTGQDVGPGEWRFERMPPGWHMTTTDQGVTLVAQEQLLEGRWSIEAELFLFPDPSDAPLGIVIQGRDPAMPPGSELRFLMRRDGMASLMARHGGADTMLVPWKADTAVRSHAGGVVKYVLRVTHDPGLLAFAVNGREMFAIPTGGEDHRSAPGLRVGPGLNVHVSRYDVITPLAPARERR